MMDWQQFDAAQMANFLAASLARGLPGRAAQRAMGGRQAGPPHVAC